MSGSRSSAEEVHPVVEAPTGLNTPPSAPGDGILFGAMMLSALANFSSSRLMGLLTLLVLAIAFTQRGSSWSWQTFCFATAMALMGCWTAIVVDTTKAVAGAQALAAAGSQ